MKAMKHSVASCSVESQSLILDKAFSVLSSSTKFLAEESLVKDSLQLAPFSCRDEWIISLYASTITSLRPETHLKNAKGILRLLMGTLLNGHVPSGQALGSLFNKMPLEGNELGSVEYCSLKEALGIVFNSYIWKSCDISQLIRLSDGYSEVDVNILEPSNANIGLVSVHAITGLAWMGKGLLMRGDEKVKDMIRFFLNCLISNGNFSTLNGKVDSHDDCKDQEMMHLTRSAADAFSTMMSDSEACLNRKLHATIRPLYKQRLFNIVMPVLLSSIVKSDSQITRSMLHRALAHVISNTPLSVILGEANKLIPLMVDGLTLLSEDMQNQDIVYNLLLVLSGILTDENGKEAVVENARIIIQCLIKLVIYPHMMLLRETAIQCLTAMSQLPYSRVYPMRTEVLRTISRALDDPKRSVRQEAVRCRQAWASIVSTSLHF